MEQPGICFSAHGPTLQFGSVIGITNVGLPGRNVKLGKSIPNFMGTTGNKFRQSVPRTYKISGLLTY